MSTSLNFLDLFAGAGGLSEGFIRAGFSPIAHVEADESACFTLKTRSAYHWLNAHDKHEIYKKYLCGTISRQTLFDYIPKNNIDSVICSRISQESISDIFGTIDHLLNGKQIDLIVGGPPCQAYSIIGRARDKNHMTGDSRNYLFVFYAAFLKHYHPKYFVFENVTGLLSAKDSNENYYFNKMQILFKEVGYETEFMTLSANDYGVPQNRKRVILVGKRGKSTGFFPEPLKWQPKILVKEILSDLPALQAGDGGGRAM